MISVNRQNISAIFLKHSIYLVLVCLVMNGCKIYSFKDVSIPPQVKTIRVGFVENRARYVDPTLSPQLTDQFKQKINNQTKLTQVLSDNADYDVTAYVSEYNISTAGVPVRQHLSTGLQ